MSRRGAAANGVRGPASALTSYLKESGIHVRSINMYRRGRIDTEDVQEEAEDELQGDVEEAAPEPAAGPSSSANAEAGPSTEAPARSNKRKRSQDYDSDALDEDEDEPSSSKKGTGSASAKAKAKAKAAAKKKAKKEEEDEEEDSYNAPSKGKGSTAAKAPSIGSFTNCAECEKKFTVTKYTQAASPPPGFLCHNCAKASGNDSFKKPAAPKKKAAQDKRKIVNFEDKERVSSLATLCITIISKHIDDVEALGEVGSANLNAIARILSRNRSLTPNNASLFYDVTNTALTLYDCTALLPATLCGMASLNPNLESLRLDYCGRMDASVLKHWSDKLPSLSRLELLGPFNIRKEAWVEFFRLVKNPLVQFAITQSPRFDLDCMEALSERFSDSLTELRLSEIGLLKDDWVPAISSFKCLTSLNLSNPANSLTDEPFVQLLRAVGSNLMHLDISGNEELSDVAFDGGIKAHAPKLVTLRASNLPLLTNQGIANFFTPPEESNSMFRGLEVIDLSRSKDPSSEALEALLAHSGLTLFELSINGWRKVGNEALLTIGPRAPHLTKIDIGWCRDADNFVVKALLDGCTGLKELSCFGCNRLNSDCPRKRGVAILGIEPGV